MSDMYRGREAIIFDLFGTIKGDSHIFQCLTPQRNLKLSMNTPLKESRSRKKTPMNDRVIYIYHNTQYIYQAKEAKNHKIFSDIWEDMKTNL